MLKAATSQLRHWQGKFGKEYTDRNALTLEDMDKMYQGHYGVTRTELNEAFLGDFERSIKILEVGSNIGNQLLMLQKMGLKNLYGIEINNYAVKRSKANTCDINIIQGSAFDIPFKDGFFDLVFTSGVLIHIAPPDIQKVLEEIHRCTNEYIWGFEYYADTYSKVMYRGQDELLWKANFPQIYTSVFPDLTVTKIKFLEYVQNENVDIMFLLKKEKG